jgi:pyrimidine deaminase RibD-like protein
MTSSNSIDEGFMHRALKLAAETIGLASPNPQVGCVLTQTPPNGSSPKVIGEGAHLYANRDHAEIVALKQAAQRGLSTIGATAYVTLEPCSHHGRTGPCADALIAAGIARCVVATQDPNPQVSGQGLAKLRAAGIKVSVGILQRRLRPLHPESNAIRHPQSRALGRRQNRPASSLTLLQPTSLAHRPRRPLRSATPPPRLRRSSDRHRHSTSRRPPTHRSQWPPRTQQPTPPPPTPPRHPRLAATNSSHLATGLLGRQRRRLRLPKPADPLQQNRINQKDHSPNRLGSTGRNRSRTRRPPQPLRCPLHPCRTEHTQPPARVRLSPQRCLPRTEPGRQSRTDLRRNRIRRQSHPICPGHRLTLSLRGIPATRLPSQLRP